MNKIVLIAIVVGGLVIAWWLISPLWRNKKLDEPLPQDSQGPVIKDSMDTMDAATEERFMKETKAMADHIMRGSDPMPSLSPSKAPAILAQAPMIARAHDVQGRAFLVQTGEQVVLRFEDLKTINGPDLRIYLSSGLNVDDTLDLGPIRATEGNVNYVLPPDADLAKYRNALIWCRAFGVLFSYAQL